MTSYAELRNDAAVWPGAMDRSLMSKRQFAAGRYLADMAKRGRWRRVRRELEPAGRLVDVKQWRPGGTTWLTVLHQAGWNGASADVVSWLIGVGALRSQTDALGRTAHDVAAQHNQPENLLELLAPPPSPLTPAQIDALDTNLTTVIDALIGQLFRGEDLRRLFRYPPVGILHEAPGQQLWFPVPYLWGGFRVALRSDHVELLGGYREQGPAGEVAVTTAGYVVTTEEVTQISEGYS